MPDLGFRTGDCRPGGTGLTLTGQNGTMCKSEEDPDGDRRAEIGPFPGRRRGATECTPREIPPEKQGQLHRIGRRQATIAAASDVHEKGALTAFSRPTPCCRQNNAISCTGLSLAIPLAEGRNSRRVGALSPEISPCSACSKFRRRIQSLCAVTIAGGSSLSATR